MSVTDNFCPTGIMAMRQAFPVPPENVRPGQRKGHHVATCHLCDHPDITVIENGDGWLYSDHKENIKVGGVTESGRSYSQRRERNW